MINDLTVSILGLGYVGLPTTLLIAQKGFKVIGYDISSQLIDDLLQKKYNSDEKDVNNLYLELVDKSNLTFSNTLYSSDIFIVCVPTPCSSAGIADLSYIFSAVDQIVSVLNEDDIIVIESTIPVGTCKEVEKYIKSKSNVINPLICHCPERVLPGSSINEILKNSRVIGGNREGVSTKVMEFYKEWVHGDISLMSNEEAELVKLIENSYRDVNLAYANTISRICNAFEISSKKIIKAANLHPRVSILDPGIGVGGHCIPVDPYFLISQLPDETKLLSTARHLNEFQPNFVTEKIINIVESFKLNYTIELLGITYKENTSDIRESPAIKIVKNLLAHFSNRKITLYDPHVTIKNLLGLKVNKLLIFFDLEICI